jgi:RES domain-containing protein
VTAKRVRRGGTYYRICGPDWTDPADTSYAKRTGGRWNPPGEFGALYLSGSLQGARANARRFIVRQYGATALLEDLNPEYLPDAQAFSVSSTMFIDAITPGGRRALRLTELDGVDADQVAYQAVARQAYADGERGIASASALGDHAFEELAIFDSFAPKIARAARRTSFAAWYPST